MLKSLYVERKVLNATEVIFWCKENNIDFTIKPEDMHVTIAYSSKAVDWNDFVPDKNELRLNDRIGTIKYFSDCLVLTFDSFFLQTRWKYFVYLGCSWDYPDYDPHVSLSYVKTTADLSMKYIGDIILGPEIFAKVGD